MYNIEQIKKDLKSNLSTYRYEHSILVAEEAKKLAKHYNLDEEKAYIAGLVHDIAKEFNKEENEKWINKYKLSGEIFMPEFKNVIHAYIGAIVIKERYGFDEEICNAVKYHAIGNIPMNNLDKIVFIADKIARKQTNSIIEQERELAYQDLDKAISLYLKNQRDKLKSEGKRMCEISLKLLQKLTDE